jgi:hypothetical protein
MAKQNFFDDDTGDQSLNIAASTRKFQQSIIVKQDPNKSGILSFLAKTNQQPGGQATTNTDGQGSY